MESHRQSTSVWLTRSLRPSSARDYETFLRAFLTKEISDGTRDPAMIQPSLTGLVYALFATQHCVLGYYQAVPAGLYATNSCRSPGAGEECTSHRMAVVAILP
jgi:hypothetical protein